MNINRYSFHVRQARKASSMSKVKCGICGASTTGQYEAPRMFKISTSGSGRVEALKLKLCARHKTFHADADFSVPTDDIFGQKPQWYFSPTDGDFCIASKSGRILEAQ